MEKLSWKSLGKCITISTISIANQVMRVVNELQARGYRTWFGAHDDLRSLALW